MTYQLPQYKPGGHHNPSGTPMEEVGSWAGLAIVVSVLSAPLTFFVALYATGHLMNIGRSLSGELSLIATIIVALIVIAIGTIADRIVNRWH